MARSFPSARHRNLVFAFFMSCLMSLMMSAVITLVNTGMDSGYPLRWLSAFVIAWAVAFPLVSLIAPIAHRLTAWTLKQSDENK
ncbi:MAG: DUF2798 domain-containing protein [Alcanivoracaceae bacterium]|nr:DUF2798 domain-containing protein [Alcanivoracaceae bacterium]